MSSKVTREQIVAEARTWTGCPFHHQGRVKGIGVDCAGVIVCVAKELGLSEFDMTGYSHVPDGVILKRALDDNMIPIPAKDRLPGDVLLFSFDKHPQHLGFCTDIGILHSYAQVRRCVETSFDEVWALRLRGAYRFRGVE